MQIAPFTNPANALTLLRIVLVAAMYPVSWRGDLLLFAVLFPLAGLTDAVDGWIARRFRMESEFGSRFDSVADYGYYYSVPLWFWWLFPDVVRSWWPWIAVPVSLFLAGEIVKIARGRGVAALHLYSSKAAGVVLVVYLTWVLWGNPPGAAFHAVWIILTVSAGEELAASLLPVPLRRDAGSLYRILRERREQGRRISG